jgi:hypothetical protein
MGGGRKDGGVVAGMIHAPKAGATVQPSALGPYWTSQLTGIVRFGTTDGGSKTTQTPSGGSGSGGANDAGTQSTTPGRDSGFPDAGGGGTKPSGTSSSSGTHGTVTTPGADGGSITYDGSTGDTTTTHPDGTSETESEATSVTQNDDGSMDISYPDGTTAHVNSDSSQDVTHPDGSTEHINADGSSSSSDDSSSSDGGYVDPDYVDPMANIDEDSLRLALTVLFADSTGPGTVDPAPEDLQPEVGELDPSRIPFFGLWDPVDPEVLTEANGTEVRPRIGGPDCPETGCGEELDLTSPPSDPNGTGPISRGGHPW